MIYRVQRFFVLTALLITILGIAGCGAAPEPKPTALDPRLAWACDRLVLSWAVGAAQLQNHVGGQLVVQAENGVGRLQLRIMHCGAPSKSPTPESWLSFAYVTVPVTADSVPLVITNVSDDGWFALPYVVADAHSFGLFVEFGYAVLPAEIAYVIDDADAQTTIESKLVFDAGHILIVANAAGEALTLDGSQVLIQSGNGFLSAFFGREQAKRYATIAARVQIAGETPLSKFNLPETPTLAVLDRKLSSNRVFWRLPFTRK